MKIILGVLVLTVVFVSYLAISPLFETHQSNPILDANAAAIAEFRNHAASIVTVSPTPVNRGSLSVYRSIDAITDCRQLKATFEKNVYDSAGREFGTFLQEVTLSYAKRAYDRMEQLGC